MKVNLKTGYVALVALTAMTACGGSSDDGAGQLSAFQTSGEVSYATGGPACPSGQKVGDVAIIGGQAPYRVLNPNNRFLSFGPGLSNTTPATPGSNYTVSNRNEQVAVFAFGCFSGDVQVLDDLGRVADFTVTAASGAGT
jgi:hypothetical protein